MELNCAHFFRVRSLGLTLLTMAATVGMSIAQKSHIGEFNSIGIVSTTVPANGDLNPYGMAKVPVTKGHLAQGSFLVSNFNNAANLQGTGTTIVQIAPDGAFSTFAQIDPSKVSCPGGVGLTTALAALKSGFVIVGSLPTSDGTSATAKAGCLIVVDSMGTVVETISGQHLNGPWDMATLDQGSLVTLFVTNVLNGTVAAGGGIVDNGTVVRLFLAIPSSGPPQVVESTVIASDFAERTDPAALVIGPTGLAFNSNTGILYVADSLNNRVTAISNAFFRSDSAGVGSVVFQGGSLNDPLGLAFTPVGQHLLVANGADGNIIEINQETHKQVAVKLADNTGGPPPGNGALFDLIVGDAGVYFVDDASNTLNLLY